MRAGAIIAGPELIVLNCPNEVQALNLAPGDRQTGGRLGDEERVVKTNLWRLNLEQ